MMCVLKSIDLENPSPRPEIPRFDEVGEMRNSGIQHDLPLPHRSMMQLNAQEDAKCSNMYLNMFKSRMDKATLQSSVHQGHCFYGGLLPKINRHVILQPCGSSCKPIIIQGQTKTNLAQTT